MEDEVFYNKLREATAEYRKLLKDELNKRWESLNLDLMKSGEYEVIWGLVSRQCTLVYQMSYSYLTWNDMFLPIIMRCMVENHINIAWILQKPNERTNMFIDYGLGRETKHLEFAKAKENKTEYDLQFIKSTEDWINQQRFTHLNKINVGGWKFNDVRSTATDAGYKEYYDIFYDVCSSATHSTWNYIAKHNLIFCENPLHKNHRIPAIKEPEIEIGMFLILAKIVNDTFEIVDKSLNINISIPSSLDYIVKALSEENNID